MSDDLLAILGGVSKESKSKLPPGFVETYQDVVDAINSSGCKEQVSLRKFKRWIEDGLDPGEPGKYDLLKIGEWKFTQGLSQDRILYQKELNRKLKLINDQMERLSINKGFVESVAYKLGTEIKKYLQPLGGKILNRIKGVTDSFEIKTSIDMECRNTTEDIEAAFLRLSFEESSEQELSKDNS